MPLTYSPAGPVNEDLWSALFPYTPGSFQFLLMSLLLWLALEISPSSDSIYQTMGKWAQTKVGVLPEMTKLKERSLLDKKTSIPGKTSKERPTETVDSVGWENDKTGWNSLKPQFAINTSYSDTVCVNGSQMSQFKLFPWNAFVRKLIKLFCYLLKMFWTFFFLKK